MFEIKNLTKRYGSEFALQEVTMNIGKGMNFITGASGSGKTTLLKILSGMDADFDGKVTYFGEELETFSAKEKNALYHSVFGFVWQDFHLIEEETVLENILLPVYIKGKHPQNEVDDILKKMKLTDIQHQKVKNLSGGQKQRTAIARELMKSPQVIFCDEPTSALDEDSAKLIMDILRTIAKTRTVVVVTHDMSLVQETDNVFQLEKGELISAPSAQIKTKMVNKTVSGTANKSGLSLKNIFQLALQHIKNQKSRFAVSVLSLAVASALLLTSFGGAVGKSSQAEFDQLMETYGEGLLDISLIGSFMSASGADEGTEDEPGGSVEQNLDGLYENYQNDSRVEFIVSAQPFENIQVTLDGQIYSIEKTGNSPVLTRLVSGSIPGGEEFQAVVPLKFVERIGLTAETALGKEIEFSATIYKWLDNQPLEIPVKLSAVICGVADNTVVYDYEGETFSFTVDDSFFFNKSAIEEVRRQAGMEDESANFIIRAKSPEALISLKDELNRKGIVPLGRFELVEDLVRLNQQTEEQSGSVSLVMGVFAALISVFIFAVTSVFRKREYAIYKISGYGNSHILKILAAEAVIIAFTAMIIMATAALTFFGGKLTAGILLVLCTMILSFAAEIPAVLVTSPAAMLKAGEKA